MGYSINPSKDRDYIVLKVVGDFKAQNMMKYIIDAHMLGKEIGINRYLVDVTEARNVDSIIDNYTFAYSDMKKAEEVDLTARVAALVSQGDHSHNFVETVLCNAVIPLKIFNEMDMAIDYLMQE